MNHFLIIQGQVYRRRQALQQPKDVFEEFKPVLLEMHEEALGVKRLLWKKLYANPKKFVEVLEKLLTYTDKISTLQNAQKLDKWAGYFGKGGLYLIDGAEALKKSISQIDDMIQEFKGTRDDAQKFAEQTRNPGYTKIVEAIDSFLQDMITPVV